MCVISNAPYRTTCVSSSDATCRAASGPRTIDSYREVTCPPIHSAIPRVVTSATSTDTTRTTIRAFTERIRHLPSFAQEQPATHPDLRGTASETFSPY